jgi:hypothetical protein
MEVQNKLGILTIARCSSRFPRMLLRGCVEVSQFPFYFTRLCVPGSNIASQASNKLTSDPFRDRLFQTWLYRNVLVKHEVWGYVT